MNYNYSFWRYSQTQADKFSHMIQSTTLTINNDELHSDITEWTETSSRQDFTSCVILTIVQAPGSHEKQTLPQEYRNMKAARIDITKTLLEMMTEFGARSYSADIQNGRLIITTDNRYRITVVLDK